MARHTLTFVLLFALLFGLGCSPSYNPTAEPFKADFPSTPTKIINRTVSQNGMTLRVHYVGCDFDGGAFAVMYSDYPQGHVQNTGIERVLTGARKGAAANAGGNILSHKSISLGNHKGQEFETNDVAKGMATRIRMYLVGDRLYQVMVVAKSGRMDNSKADQFFDSFELK
jgi:hypothetical protein